MEFLWEGFKTAVHLILSGDAETWHAAWVTIFCSFIAVALAAPLAVTYGGWLAVYRPRGHRLQVLLLRIGMFVPTIFIGTMVWGFLSRRGPLGELDMLYTKGAIIAGEFLLVFPILGALTHSALEAPDRRPFETARTLGAGPVRTLLTLLGEVRGVIVGAMLMACARCFSELGISVTVGGNLQWQTSTLSGGAQLMVRQGEFGEALALGFILLFFAGIVAVLAPLVSKESKA